MQILYLSRPHGWFLSTYLFMYGLLTPSFRAIQKLKPIDLKASDRYRRTKMLSGRSSKMS